VIISLKLCCRNLSLKKRMAKRSRSVRRTARRTPRTGQPGRDSHYRIVRTVQNNQDMAIRTGLPKQDNRIGQEEQENHDKQDNQAMKSCIGQPEKGRTERVGESEQDNQDGRREYPSLNSFSLSLPIGFPQPSNYALIHPSIFP
jgi:hypothetical protein